ncbi:MAG TPA: class I SAM-dependent methyltransferase [Amnibacterium sp.]|jgi:predicted O-methyltransferase YrrM|uniref:O-methyltransferase n=1 Tax=Amnibacterium sp. TaxID=1872496 RepID=UPI002F9487CF
MPDSTTGAVFADAFAAEDEAILSARDASAQFGIEPVSPAVGAALAVAAAARPAASIVEIGTGAGVSGLWLLRGAPAAQLTTIDVDLDHHQVARSVFAEAGHPKQVRFITGDARDVLPRMNDDSYDLVLVDADWESLPGYVDAALRLARVGGTVLVARALQGGKVANPARRDRATVTHRDLLKAVRDRSDLLAALLPVGDGLLQLVRR